MKKITYGLSGPKCRARRDVLGHTQAVVAKAAGMSPQQYANTEQAKLSNPTLDVACRIAAALLCHVDDLVG